jgi:hypothetical protein
VDVVTVQPALPVVFGAAADSPFHRGDGTSPDGRWAMSVVINSLF